MNKDVPKANNYLFEKWTKINQQKHKRSLSTAKPVMHIEAPDSLSSHPKYNKKRELMINEQNLQIQKENQRISQYIESKRKTPNMIKLSSSSNHNQFAATLSKSFYNQSDYEPSTQSKSLNWTFRKHQTRRIEQENQEMLKRIVDKTSEYNSVRYKYEFKKHMDYVNIVRHHSNRSEQRRSKSILSPTSSNNKGDQFIKEQRSKSKLMSQIVDRAYETRIEEEIHDIEEQEIQSLLTPNLNYIRKTSDELELMNKPLSVELGPQVRTINQEDKQEPNVQEKIDINLDQYMFNKTTMNKSNKLTPLIVPLSVGYNEDIRPDRLVLYQRLHNEIGKGELKIQATVEISKSNKSICIICYNKNIFMNAPLLRPSHNKNRFDNQHVQKYIYLMLSQKQMSKLLFESDNKFENIVTYRLDVAFDDRNGFRLLLVN